MDIENKTEGNKNNEITWVLKQCKIIVTRKFMVKSTEVKQNRIGTETRNLLLNALRQTTIYTSAKMYTKRKYLNAACSRGFPVFWLDHITTSSRFLCLENLIGPYRAYHYFILFAKKLGQHSVAGWQVRIAYNSILETRMPIYGITHSEYGVIRVRIR